MPRHSQNGGRSTPHEVPLDRFRTVTDVKHAVMVIRNPRPECRAAGMRAWDAGQSRMSNPHPVLSVEHAHWDSGWNQRCEENS